MRILLLIDSLAGGGAQRQILLLGEQLLRKGIDVQLAYYIEELRYARHQPVEGLQTVCISNRYGYFGVIVNFYRLVRRYQPDVVISYLTFPNQIARIAKLLGGGFVHIASERNIDLPHYRSRVLAERCLNHVSELMVVNCRQAADMLHAVFNMPMDKLAIIYNGLDPVQFSRVSADVATRRRQQLGIADQQYVFVLPGRVMPQKNHLCLVKALMLLAPTLVVDWLVLFVGNEIDLEYKKNVMTLLQEYPEYKDRFRFAGGQSSMSEIYSLADIVVLPSLWEGFPNVIIEAMACEAIVIASDIADNGVIIDHGINGFLFPKDDERALADCILQCTEMSVPARQAVQLQAKAKILELCALESFSERYLELCRRLLSRAGG